jgi:Glycosyltransferase family 87
MALNKLGKGLMIAGLGGILLSLLLVILPGARAEVKAFQILAIEISIVIILAGAWLAWTQTAAAIAPVKQIRDLASGILNLPVFTWVFIGFLVVYLGLFLFPVFLHSGMQMNYVTGYIPNLVPIGNDLTVMVDLIQGWLAGNRSPYTIQFYPPLTYIIFAPLALIRDPVALYRTFTLFTLTTYFLLTWLLPRQIIDRRYTLLALLLFVTGLLSYGFQFELERGQYNVFTFLLCMTASYIFHYHPRYRLLAYFLFSLSVQLKLYPAIFIFMFVDDWREWKSTLRRFVGLGLLNLLLFFVMGVQSFWDFIRSVTAQVVNPSWIGVWNHSLSSFISVAKQDGLGLIGRDTLRAFRHHAESWEALLLIFYAVLLLTALVIFYLRKQRGLDPYLLLTCTIGALILPISYDYTLSILTVPVLLFLSGIPEIESKGYKVVAILLVLGIAIAYFAILIPYNFRPYALNNSFPLLFFILLLATCLNFLRYRQDKIQRARSESPV